MQERPSSIVLRSMQLINTDDVVLQKSMPRFHRMRGYPRLGHDAYTATDTTQLATDLQSELLGRCIYYVQI